MLLQQQDINKMIYMHLDVYKKKTFYDINKKNIFSCFQSFRTEITVILHYSSAFTHTQTFHTEPQTQNIDMQTYGTWSCTAGAADPSCPTAFYNRGCVRNCPG